MGGRKPGCKVLSTWLGLVVMVTWQSKSMDACMCMLVRMITMYVSMLFFILI